MPYAFLVFAGVNLLTNTINQFLSKSRQEEQINAQNELAQLREKAAQALQRGQQKHAEKMFRQARQKELNLTRLQLENQIELANHSTANARENIDFNLALTNFPLNLTPLQILNSPDALAVITNHGPLPALDGPPSDGAGYLTRARELDVNLSLFLQNGYGSGDPAHRTLFFEGSWKNRSMTGQTAAAALYSFLKSRAAVYVEYQAIKDEIFVNVAHWAPGSDSFDYFTFARFGYSAGQRETATKRIAALQALAAGATADMHALTRSHASPALPRRLAEIVNGDGDEVVREAAEQVLAAYRSALRVVAESTPERATDLALEMAEDLLAFPDKRYAEQFLVASLGMFIEARGAALPSAIEVSDVLDHAVSLGLPLDQPYFARARGLRQHLFDKGWDSELVARALPVAVPQSFSERLAQTREALEQIREGVENITRLCPEDLDAFLQGDGAAEGLTTAGLVAEIDHSLEGLRTPTFRMVPVGVTNAGKSTLIGSIIGRDLLPRGSGEVSRGVLRFIHAPGEFSVQEVFSPGEEGGEDVVKSVPLRDGLETPDEKIAAYLKEKMVTFSESGAREGEQFPRVEIRTPMLPGVWRTMFELPPEVSFEVADVPGLNSTDNNDHNLAIIQEEVRGSFCLFVLDWNTTDKERDEMLLQTVKDMLEATGADRESVIFVINKFDALTRDDLKADIERRLNSFRATLRRGLALREDPEIITMSSLTWFYGQVAWGPSPLDDAPVAAPAVRARMLEGLVADSGTIRKLPKGDARRLWFRDKIEDGSPDELTDDDLRRLLNEIIYPESGAALFRERIADRVRRRCASLVIRPVVSRAWRMAETFMARVQQRSKHAQLIGTEKITDEIERIRNCTDALRAAIDTESKSFAEAASLTVQAFGSMSQGRAKSKKPDEVVQGFELWLKNKDVNVSDFGAIVADLSKELRIKIARPLRDFQPGQALPNYWRELLRKSRAESLHRAAGDYFERLKLYSATDDELRKEYAVRDHDTAGLARIKEATALYDELLKQLRMAVNERCDYFIQMKLARMLENAQRLLDSFYDFVGEKAKEVVGDVDLTAAILAGKQPPPIYERQISLEIATKSLAQLNPEDRLVEEQETAIIRSTVRVAGDSFRWLKRKIFGGSTQDLFQTVTKTVYHERGHSVSYLPSGAGLEEQANKGFDEKEQELSRQLSVWLEGLLNSYAEVLSSASAEVSASMTAALHEQLRQTTDEHRRGIDEWKKLNGDLRNCFALLGNLERAVSDSVP
jgi:GTP-binding protein EngB required for normal cell division